MRIALAERLQNEHRLAEFFRENISSPQIQGHIAVFPVQLVGPLQKPGRFGDIPLVQGFGTLGQQLKKTGSGLFLLTGSSGP